MMPGKADKNLGNFIDEKNNKSSLFFSLVARKNMHIDLSSTIIT